MRTKLQVIIAMLLLTTLIAGEWQSIAAAPSETLVFEGTVTSITTIDHPLTRWLVTMKVTKVISGEFSGSTFQFAVHSPAQPGLEKGHTLHRQSGVEGQWLFRRREPMATTTQIR